MQCFSWADVAIFLRLRQICIELFSNLYRRVIVGSSQRPNDVPESDKLEGTCKVDALVG